MVTQRQLKILKGKNKLVNISTFFYLLPSPFLDFNIIDIDDLGVNMKWCFLLHFLYGYVHKHITYKFTFILSSL